MDELDPLFGDQAANDFSLQSLVMDVASRGEGLHVDLVGQE